MNAFANLEQLSAVSYWGPAKPQQTHLQCWGLFDAFKNYQNWKIITTLEKINVHLGH